MRVLMFSMDRSLVGEKTATGDTVLRHRAYGGFCEQLDIVVFTKQGYQKQELAENVYVWPTNSTNRLFYFRDAIAIGKKIAEEKKYQLMIGDIFTGLAAYIVSRRRAKFLMHMHGDFWANKQGLEGRFSNYILMIISKFLARKADAIRVVSDGIKNKLVRTGIDKVKIFVIPTPFDLKKFLVFDQARVNQLKKEYSGRNLLFVGRLEKIKNLEWFLTVFQELKKDYHDLNFLIIGQGSQTENLQMKAKLLKIEKSVKFVGRVDYADLVHYYQIAQVVVLMSRSESFGKVLIEAGAVGLPTVVSATTGAKEIINDGQTGFIVPINNKKQTIDRIKRLLEDGHLRNDMGEKAKQHVINNFDGDLNLKKIIKLWQSLVFGDL